MIIINICDITSLLNEITRDIRSEDRDSSKGVSRTVWKREQSEKLQCMTSRRNVARVFPP